MSNDDVAAPPVRSGRTRLIVIAVVVAVVLAAAGVFTAFVLTGGAQAIPSATSTPRPTASGTPSPTTPPVASVVLDGDCSELIADAKPDQASAFSPYSDEPSSAQLLGGLICIAPVPDGLQSLKVSVFPEGAVAATVRDAYASMRCSMTRVCELGQEVGAFWIVMSASPLVDPFEDEERTRVELQTVFDELVDQVTPALEDAVVQPVERQATWWQTAPCATMTSTIESALGSALEQQFPGDAVPEGAVWDVLVEAGLQSWCPWTGSTTAAPTSVEVFVQPGIGAPDPAQLDAGTPIDVTGADASWKTESAESGTARIVSVVGPNRLLILVRSAVDPGAPSRIAAAVIAQLDAELTG